MTDLECSVEQINSQFILACDLTQQIIDLAHKTELEELEALNLTRLQLIETIFNNDKNKINITLAQKLLDLNAQAMTVLKQQMALNMKAQIKSRKGNAAHSAYMNHSA